MIHCAVYHGDHGFDSPKKLSKELTGLLHTANFLKEEFILNVDMLFENEIDPYISEILCPLLIEIPIAIHIEAKARPTIRRIRRILKHYMIYWESTKMNKGRYRMKVWNE